MVSVLALNKLELRDMITAEMVENPVLEELEATVPLLDDISRREEERERQAQEEIKPEATPEEKDPFDEVDFGQYFQEYLDPGYRSRQEWEDVEKPSFENFVSKPSTLTDHLMWQLSAMHVRDEVVEAAELIIGNLEEDGYLTATEDELLGIELTEEAVVSESAPEAEKQHGLVDNVTADAFIESLVAARAEQTELTGPELSISAFTEVASEVSAEFTVSELTSKLTADEFTAAEPASLPAQSENGNKQAQVIRVSMPKPNFDRESLREALALVQKLDPIGVACRNLRECLLAQIKHHQQAEEDLDGEEGQNRKLLADCTAILHDHLKALQKKEYREIAKAIGRSLDAVMLAVEYIKRLDPKPGLRYNITQPRLIEPDVAIVKQGDEYFVFMNDDDMPQLRLNPAYRKLLNRETAEKDVRTYVKERYKSAIQLIKNIEQRKQTIMKVCYSVIQRQREFLDNGIDHLKPMMIKEVAEEIGVHPSTVSRAVAGKYAHTAQGVFELRYFFSESVNGPEGGGTSLLILKRRVKKIIEQEDATKPLTDDQITRVLQTQGIQVTRRTVAKYREDMKIPSTHQRRVKN